MGVHHTLWKFCGQEFSMKKCCLQRASKNIHFGCFADWKPTWKTGPFASFFTLTVTNIQKMEKWISKSNHTFWRWVIFVESNILMMFLFLHGFLSIFKIFPLFFIDASLTFGMPGLLEQSMDEWQWKLNWSLYQWHGLQHFGNHAHSTKTASAGSLKIWVSGVKLARVITQNGLFKWMAHIQLAASQMFAFSKMLQFVSWFWIKKHCPMHNTMVAFTLQHAAIGSFGAPHLNAWLSKFIPDVKQLTGTSKSLVAFRNAGDTLWHLISKHAYQWEMWHSCALNVKESSFGFHVIVVLTPITHNCH